MIRKYFLNVKIPLVQTSMKHYVKPWRWFKYCYRTVKDIKGRLCHNFIPTKQLQERRNEQICIYLGQLWTVLITPSFSNLIVSKVLHGLERLQNVQFIWCFMFIPCLLCVINFYLFYILVALILRETLTLQIHIMRLYLLSTFFLQ